MAEFLIDAGADIDWVDAYGNAPLVDAAREKRLDMARLLVENREVCIMSASKYHSRP